MKNLTMNEKVFYHKIEPTIFDRIAQQYLDRLYRTAIILTKSPQEADQLIQQTYSQAKKYFHQLEPGTNFGSWISKILVNTFIKKYGGFSKS